MKLSSLKLGTCQIQNSITLAYQTPFQNAVLSYVCGLPFILLPFLHIEIEVRMTDHLRDFALDLEKYKVVQVFPMYT
jgi:hypothetical protein